jgi:probable rRNA maturation factor
MLEVNNLTKKRINKSRANKIAQAFFKKYKFSADRTISLAIISDKKMKQINLAYRGKNKTTDVLTFPDLDEILISFDQVSRQAKESGIKVKDEFDFIFVHGLLHLAGFNDDNEPDRLKMIKRGEDFLASLD